MAASRGDWPTLVASARSVSTAAVELSALSAPELPGLLGYLAGNKPGFKFISVHGPSKGWDGSSVPLIAAVERLPAWIDTMVLHPETLTEPEALREIGPRIALENMDARKLDARSADELGPFFELLPGARFCFDIAHAASVDPTMRVAEELLNRFGERLSHLHLSSLTEHGKHVTLSGGDWQRFKPLLERCRGVPWVLEAPL